MKQALLIAVALLFIHAQAMAGGGASFHRKSQQKTLDSAAPGKTYTFEVKGACTVVFYWAVDGAVKKPDRAQVIVRLAGISAMDAPAKKKARIPRSDHAKVNVVAEMTEGEFPCRGLFN